FERTLGGNSDHIGTRGHHLAHGLIAKRHYLLNQQAVPFFEYSFFGSGGDESFNVFRRIRILRRRLLCSTQIEQRLKETERRRKRSDDQSQKSSHGKQRKQPLSRKPPV